MDFKVSTHENSGVSIVQLGGRLVLGNATRMVRDTVKDMIARGQTKVLLDLGEVDYMDSAGLGTLVACYSSASNVGGQLKLLHVSKKMHEQLVITKLVTVFENFDDEAQAVASFQSAAQA